MGLLRELTANVRVVMRSGKNFAWTELPYGGGQLERDETERGAATVAGPSCHLPWLQSSRRRRYAKHLNRFPFYTEYGADAIAFSGGVPQRQRRGDSAVSVPRQCRAKFARCGKAVRFITPTTFEVAVQQVSEWRSHDRLREVRT
jgi:hypothetical protein